ncbi:MAG: glycosyltransferase family 2 protein [Candidatus Woesearchaeota archaeon]
MRLSIIIPTYNEENTLVEVIKRVKNVYIGNISKEIIIVDDGSRDGTRKILHLINDKQIKIIFHEKNKGKGAAIRTGIKNATGEIIMIQDADLEYDINEYPMLLKPILDGNASVVYGSRFIKLKKVPKYRIHYIGNIGLTFITNLLFGGRITDMETCYKVFKADVIKNIRLRAKRFDFEPEVTAKVLKKRIKIVEVPISYHCRDFKEGKKITWRDGIKAFFYLIKYRFVD